MLQPPLVDRMKERLALDTEKYSRMRAAWLTVYHYYGVLLNESQELLFAEDMMSYSVENVASAMRAWRMTMPPEGHKPRPPMPVDLVPFLTGDGDPQAQCTLIAMRIFTAISTHGRTHPKEAEARLGPFAWNLVKILGGWDYLCRESEAKNASHFHAQVRELAKGALVRKRSDEVLNATEAEWVLPEPPRAVAVVMQPEMALRRLPKPSRDLDEFNAMVAKLAQSKQA